MKHVSRGQVRSKFAPRHEIEPSSGLGVGGLGHCQRQVG